MSTGGLFKLITNDGKQDMMLMATSLLNQRLADVRAQRAGLGLDDTPTLLDIERTHILFTNAHFKPFAAIGFEYNVVSVQTGSVAFGSEVSFNIPQFGDFFTDMAVYVQMGQPVLSSNIGTVDENAPLMRWCSYPGERLFDQVKFEVNGNVLDDYYSYEVNFFREFCIPPNKLLGWHRLVGQEELEEGYVDQPLWVNNGVAAKDVVSRRYAQFASGLQTPSGQKSGNVEMFVPLLFWFNNDVRLAIPSVAIPQGSRYIRIKITSSSNMANLVPRGSGTWASPNGSLNFEGVKLNMQLYVNNIFVNPEVHNIFIKRVGFSLIRVHRRQTFTTSNPAYELQCQQLKWPIEYIYAGMKMSDYNSSDAALQSQHLDKWHTFDQVVPRSRSTPGWLCKRKYVQGSVTIQGTAGWTFNNSLALNSTRLRLTTAAGATVPPVLLPNTYPVIAANQLVVGDVLRFTFNSIPLDLTVKGVIEGTSSVSPVIEFEESTLSAANVWGTSNATLLGTTFTVPRLHVEDAEQSCTVWTHKPTLDSINIKAHGIDLYQVLPSQFYSSYLPYVFGGPNVNVPKDKGCHLVNFALYPGTYQPSGHVNVSRAREFYFNYVSSVIGGTPGVPSVVNQPVFTNNTSQGYLYLLAAAINFLLISDGGAVLRYST
jgi:hypothetical protein